VLVDKEGRNVGSEPLISASSLRVSSTVAPGVFEEPYDQLALLHITELVPHPDTSGAAHLART
jgi:hypothetical protein